MPVLPDAAALERIAGHLHGHADELRRRAGSLELAAERVQWRSTAAEAFRSRVRELSWHMSSAASRVDDAAQTMREHAGCVRHRVAVLAAAAKLANPARLVVEAIEDMF